MISRVVSTSTSSAIIGWSVIWLIAAGLVGFVAGGVNLPLYNRLVTKGVETQATVVELMPQNHNTVRYEYWVGGTKFEGHRQSRLPNPPIDQISVGQSLVIYYDPQSPSRSVLGDPKPMLGDEIIAVGLAVLGMPTFMVVVLILRQREKHFKDG